MKKIKPFSLLVKPAGADCNLRCDYCFYIDHLTKKNPHPRMSDTVLKEMISGYMATNQPQYSFGWQGGEPTLMGLDFFKKVIEYQKKYGKQGAIVANGLQTNATMITDEFAGFLSKYNFLVGISLDGPEDIHNKYRKNIGSKPTHHLVLKGIEKLRKYRVDFNILTLVNAEVVQHPKKIYNYLKSNDFLYHQYIPCVEYDSNGDRLPFSITGEEWGDFLCSIFDDWKKEDKRKISIRLFDSIIDYLIYGRYILCQMGTSCIQYFVVDYNGDIYPCDFFVQKSLKLGNISENTWNEMQTSQKYQKFGKQKLNWNKECNSCPFLEFCHGDCQKHRITLKNPSNPSNPNNLNNPNNSNYLPLCKGWKKFYTHCLPDFIKIAKTLKQELKIQSDFKMPKIK